MPAPAPHRSARSRPATPPPGHSSRPSTPASSCASPRSMPAKWPASGTASSSGNSSPALVVTMGVTASTTGSAYTPYATIYDRSTHQVIASNPDATYCEPDACCPPVAPDFFPWCQLDADDQLPPGGGAGGHVRVHRRRFVGFQVGIRPHRPVVHPGPGGDRVRQLAVGRVLPAHSARQLHEDRRLQQCVTDHLQWPQQTTLWSWWVHHKLLANTGQQSGSDWVAVPGDLSNGGGSFQTFFVP